MERLESSPLSFIRKQSGEDSRRSIRFAISVNINGFPDGLAHGFSGALRVL